MAIELIGSLHRLTKDREGAVTLTFSIPKSHAAAALSVPEEVALSLTILTVEDLHELKGRLD